MLTKNNYLTAVFILLILLFVFFQPYCVQAQESQNKTNIEGTPTFNQGILIIILLIFLLLVMFIWEPLPIGVISLCIPVILIILDFWTKVSVEDALSGFSNSATITVMAMFVISRGIQNSGAMQFLGNKIIKYTGDNEKKQVIAISGLTGIIAGFINNTPTVATFIPMVTDLARKTKVSPSKLLIPLSYAAMLGGTLTLLGTSTNLLGSQVSARLINHPFSMFEFTKLGIVVFVVGILYLITIGHRLIPERIRHDLKDYIEEYEIEKYLTEIKIAENSPLIGQDIGELLSNKGKNLDIIQLNRNNEKYMEPLELKTIRPNDHLVIRADYETVLEFAKINGVIILPEIKISQAQLENEITGQKVIELVIPDNSFLKGRTINNVNFLNRYDASLLAIRHGGEIAHTDIKNFYLREGDVLLLLAAENTIERLKENQNFIIRERDETETIAYKPLDIILSVGIAFSIIILASLKILPIPIATLAGIAAMVILKLIDPQEIYDSINWEVIFLLAGLIPLGVAIEQTGTAKFIANQILNIAGFLPDIIVLAIFYYMTTLLTDIISNNATVVLMIPVAINAADQIGANPFAFVLAVTFAASASFASPVGYQTNLMVYGPGGYKFRDYVLVGAPLEIIMAVIVPIAISIFWGL
ncbi:MULTISPECIES: SLC13 family permease [Halanaerobium]|jgi:di/tricarboxylate transporter|uniref:TrkA family protein n=2 Tax=Halanaerobium TaxID=2330 RepID=A0A1G9NB23_9FIRM|nr:MULTISPECIES: SLC13 family permease [Halanaerobium]KXS48437.1 MAG: di-/tricarboxylate transporter [Halanaerobium sp. T82-1]PUU90426.1 MAG: di-/tricarboxylate transporter [Halanaerobium sp.]RCW60278.1 TrkA family protein [Halanaerobium sp. ST460_2HS_T2]TDS34671.1 TrkA family protein [Halanaerobium congolense]SDH49794.1 TrkA-C domain-containing protein [Halanaerobium congolense]